MQHSKSAFAARFTSSDATGAGADCGSDADMPQHLVLSVMSKDRVGIIAAVTRAVYELKGNIDAISQTVMRGYFTLILTVAFPDESSPDEIRRKIEGEGHKGELAVSVQPRDLKAAQKPVVRGGEQFVLTIMGRDHPGIISRISSYLASRGINIVDLYAYTEGENFVMIGQVMLPSKHDVAQIQIDLGGLWRDTDMTVSLQHENIFSATNEVDFRHSRTESTEL